VAVVLVILIGPVSDLEYALVAEQQVGSLEVTVDDPVVMQMLNTTQQLQ